MKKIKISIILILSLVAFGGSTSCKKSFLEIVPKEKLIAQKVADYDLLLNNLELGNQAYVEHFPLGDEFAAFNPYFSVSQVRTQRAFKWEPDIFDPADDAGFITLSMRALYTYNIIINEVMVASDGTDDQRKALFAEALAGRAWVYFQLINLFGKPYNAVTSASDLGFPIVTKADVTETNFNDRSTVKAVYDFIVADLLAAIPSLSQPSHRIRMSKPAAEGILAKVYMFMGKFNEALPLLNSSIVAFNNSVYPVKLYDYNIVFAPGGSFLPIGTFGPTMPTLSNNEESGYSRQATNNWAFTNNDLLLIPQVTSLYGTTDHRKKFQSNFPYPSGAAFPAGFMRRIGPLSQIIGLLLQDLYLLRAEAKARLNDLSGAKLDVESLRVKRMPAADAPVPIAVSTDRAALLKFILDERMREFAGTGFRWFDMRRFSVDPEAFIKATVRMTHTLYAANGTVVTIYNLSPERFTLKIPPKILNQNPGMQDNP